MSVIILFPSFSLYFLVFSCFRIKTFICVFCKTDGHGPGWKEVPADDPAVQDAANHAVKIIHQRSNSLFPYELKEIVCAKAEVFYSWHFFLFSSVAPNSLWLVFH